MGWSELEGIANRGDFDLTQHAERVRREARVLRPGEGRGLRPDVIEPAAGVDRAMLAFMVDAYDSEEVEGESARSCASTPGSRR